MERHATVAEREYLAKRSVEIAEQSIARSHVMAARNVLTLSIDQKGLARELSSRVPKVSLAHK